MDFYGYTISINNVKFFLVFSILFLLASLIIFILCSYFVLKFLQISIDNNNVFFYQYNKKSQKILDIYGDYKVSKIYLVRQPLGKSITFLLNVITLYNYEKLILESHDNFPYHTLIIFEIEMPDNKRKLLLLEKNNCISICENFIINQLFETKLLQLKQKNCKNDKNRYTLKSILKSTQERIGNEKFFNWHICKNNCQEFIKEVLITINKYSKSNKEFIFRNKIMKHITQSEFTLHICNCLCVIYNIIEKYIYDNNIFN